MVDTILLHEISYQELIRDVFVKYASAIIVRQYGIYVFVGSERNNLLKSPLAPKITHNIGTVYIKLHQKFLENTLVIIPVRLLTKFYLYLPITWKFLTF